MGRRRPPPVYLALTDFARHLIGRLEANAVGTFDAVFDLVERWHLEGDHDVAEAAAIGLLEDLQNENLYASASPKDFEPWLKPRSALSWAELNRAWNGDGKR